MVFLGYCVYGFLFPLVITFIIFMLNYHQSLPDHLLNNLGPDVCSIGESDNGKIYYMAIPLAIIISENIIFFSITAFTIWSVQKQTASVTSTARLNQNKQRLKCFKFNGFKALDFIQKKLNFINF